MYPIITNLALTIFANYYITLTISTPLGLVSKPKYIYDYLKL